MRVLWVDNSIEWGGVQVHLAWLARAACARGHQACLACDPRLAPRYRAQLSGTPVRIAASAGHALLSPAGWLRFWRALRAERPDVVHAHLYWSMRLAAPLAKLARVPRVVETLHLEERPRPGLRRLLTWLDAGLRRLCVDRLIAVSASVAASVRNQPGLRTADLRTIPNAVAPETGAPSGRRPHHLAFLGRLEPQKGVDVLLEALALLRREGIELDLKIGGTGRCEEALRRQCRELGLEAQVRFCGAVTDRTAFLADRSILVLPSRYEGLPLVLLEAAGHELCVVASAVSGIPELIEDGRHGLLCPPESPLALARALGRAASQDALRADCARALARRVQERHSPETCLDRTLEALS